MLVSNKVRDALYQNTVIFVFIMLRVPYLIAICGHAQIDANVRSSTCSVHFCFSRHSVKSNLPGMMSAVCIVHITQEQEYHENHS